MYTAVGRKKVDSEGDEWYSGHWKRPTPRQRGSQLGDKNYQALKLPRISDNLVLFRVSFWACLFAGVKPHRDRTDIHAFNIWD
jgi:hypothetical protein